MSLSMRLQQFKKKNTSTRCFSHRRLRTAFVFCWVCKQNTSHGIHVNVSVCVRLCLFFKSKVYFSNLWSNKKWQNANELIFGEKEHFISIDCFRCYYYYYINTISLSSQIRYVSVLQWRNFIESLNLYNFFLQMQEVFSMPLDSMNLFLNGIINIQNNCSIQSIDTNAYIDLKWLSYL